MDYVGLSSEKAKELVEKYGLNEIPQRRKSLFLKIVKNFFSPIALMLLAASGLSFFLGKIFDGYFILVLLFLNIAITLWQENKADNAIRKLNENLRQKIRVFRDSKWQYIDSRFLVSGDVVELSIGEIVPVDGIVVEAKHVQVNESALSGESLPKGKNKGDSVFSGSFIAAGIAVVKVGATGVNTHFGKTLFSVERLRKQSLLEKDIISISKFLTILSLVAVLVLSAVFLLEKASFLELLTLDLSLIIAGIPISLPTVMTLIIEFGVLNLAKENVVVRRLSALEDLANVNFLLTDKTGTLTENRISVSDVYAYGKFVHKDVLQYAAIVASGESDNPIDNAVLEKAKELKISAPKLEVSDFVPADSDRKRSTIFFKDGEVSRVVSLGAPQIIEAHCVVDPKTRTKFNREVGALAASGFRTLAVAVSDTGQEEKMQLVGLVALSDTLRTDAASVIRFMEENGIGVAMVTGDNRAIASQIAGQLEMKGKNVVVKEELDKLKDDKLDVQYFGSVGAFAEILPEDKLRLVERGKKLFVIAATGDGINDLPAIKAANVGIAVKNAVSALRATADIVLLSAGISVIRDAIIESRKIFERIYTYSLYRISESLRLIVTIAILGILYRVYPMTPLQIILIALLNDIPIISLAFDRVKTTKSPAKIDAKKRFSLSSLYGMAGVLNSILLFVLVRNILHLDWPVVQTMYFLKLTVSGHMLIFVAHTKQRWWKFLPSKEVITATTLTQLAATALAFSGLLMPGKLTVWEIGFVWIWAFIWMQVSEFAKVLVKQK